VLAPLFPLIKVLFRRHILTTEQIGRAMLNVVRKGAPKRVLVSEDIAALA